MKTFTFFIALIILCSCTLTAQWTLLGLEGRSIKDIACGKDAIFAVTADSGSVYRSTDDGSMWDLVIPSGVSHVAVSTTSRIVFVIKQDSPDTTVVYRSTDNGTSWITSMGKSWMQHINIEVSPTGKVYVGICVLKWGAPVNYLVISTDDGESWNSTGTTGGRCLSFYHENVVSTGVVCGEMGCGDIWSTSIDNGDSWTPSL